MNNKINFTDSMNNYFEGIKKALDNLNRDEINEAINAILAAYNKDGNIYIFGNGGSAATASHFACDFNKNVCEKTDKKFNFICLNDNTPTIMAIANDISYDDIFSFQMKNKLKENDLVIGISGSGNSKNIIKGVYYALECGIDTLGISGYDGGRLRQLTKYHLHVNINDMQMTEDIHMIFDHMMMRCFYEMGCSMCN